MAHGSTISFNALLTNYPFGDNATVKKQIGGKVDADWIENTCAIRMSYTINLSGVEIPYDGTKTISGANGKWHYYRIKDLQAYLENHNAIFGVPGDTDTSSLLSKPFFSGKIAGKRGIIIYHKQFSNATGHITLWDGNSCIANDDYLNVATRVTFFHLDNAPIVHVGPIPGVMYFRPPIDTHLFDDALTERHLPPPTPQKPTDPCRHEVSSLAFFSEHPYLTAVTAVGTIAALVIGAKMLGPSTHIEHVPPDSSTRSVGPI